MASPMGPSQPSLLTVWQRAAPLTPLGVPFFTSKTPEPGRKRAPPQPYYVFYFLFLPPVGVAAMSTSPPIT